MKHFVAYHNPDKMGQSLHDANPLRVLTNTSVERLEGNTVWFVTRDDTPERKYALGSVFHVNEVGETTESRFAHFAAGEGHEFEPPVPLGTEEWFKEFLRTMANFSLGVPELTDPRIIEALKAFAKRAGAEIKHSEDRR